MFLIQDFIDQDILKKKKIWYIILTSMLDDSKVASGLNVAQGPPIKYASLSSLNCLISETSSVNHFSIYTAMCTCLMVTLFVQCPERRTQSDVAHLPCVFEAFQQNVKITVFDECKHGDISLLWHYWAIQIIRCKFLFVLFVFLPDEKRTSAFFQHHAALLYVQPFPLCSLFIHRVKLFMCISETFP